MNRTISLALISLMTLAVNSQIIHAQGSLQDAPYDTVLANRLFLKARQYRKESNYGSSNYNYEKAAIIYRNVASRDNRRTAWERFIRCYAEIGRNAADQKELDKALKYLNDAFNIGSKKIGKNNNEISRICQILGNVYWDKRNYEKARESWDKWILISKEILGTEVHGRIGSIYNFVGYRDWAVGELDRAETYLKKSEDIRLQLSGRDSLALASTYNNLGLVRKDKGFYEEALVYYDKALQHREKLSGKNHYQMGRIWNNIGAVYNLKGDYDKAIQFHNKASGIDIDSKKVAYNDIANALGNLGLVYQNLQTHDKAIDFIMRAKEIFEARKDTNRTAISLSNLGESYAALDDYNRALSALDTALSLLFDYEKNPHRVAIVYYNIGYVYQKDGQHELALEYLNKALEMQLSISNNKHPLLGDIFRTFGDVFYSSLQIKEALAYYQKSIISLVMDFNDIDAKTNPKLVRILDEQKLLRSLKAKAQALTSLANNNSGTPENLRIAVSTYKTASELIVRMRRGLKAKSSKIFLGNQSAEIYEQAIQTALELHALTNEIMYKEWAFLFAEKNKLGVLLEAMQELEATKFGGISTDRLQEEKKLRADLHYYELELLKEQQRIGDNESRKKTELENILFSLREEYEKFLERLDAENPRYHDMKYKDNTVSVAELQALLKEGEAIIEYFVGKDIIFLFTIQPNDLKIVKIPNENTLKDQVAALEAVLVRNQARYESFTKASSSLFESILKPALENVPSKKLIIVPDSYLNNIPFEVFLTSKATDVVGSGGYGERQFLIKDYTISYNYSASLLSELRRRGPSKATHDFVAFAPAFLEGLPSDSTLEYMVRSNLDIDSSRSKLSSLPHSIDEVIGIRKAFNARHGFPIGWFKRIFNGNKGLYLKTEATEVNVKTVLLSDYRYVHFSTHGFANQLIPGLSGLVFGKDSTASEDGILHLTEIYNLDLNADLVSLSACETGVGKYERGEGLMGLSRGFFYSGARRLLVSLWNVNDRSTSKLMISFYKNFLSGLGKAEALRKAKLDMIKNSTIYSEPYYWAPFILMGN